MPHVAVNGVSLYYEESAGAGAPILFSHGLLFSGRMWEPQVACFGSRHRVVTYDHRGQGRSADPGGRTHDMEEVTADAIALIERLGLGPCHFVGLSMGGFVGLRIAARRPELLRSLTILDSSAEPEPRENVPRYRLLGRVASWFGVGVVVSRVMPIMMARSTLRDPEKAPLVAHWRRELSANARGIVRAVTGVIERKGVTDELATIRVPTLVMVGEEDVATVPAKSERMAAAIAGARLVRIPRAGHSSNLEQPALVNAELKAFFAALG